MKTFNMHILKGASGTGKGTRVSQLIEWLKTQETPIVWTPQKKPFGLLFPKHGFMFIGCYTESNKSGLTSWSSMDMVHATVKTADAGREILRRAKEYAIENSSFDTVSLVVEGEPMFLSDKYRPKFISEFYEPDNLYMSYFVYASREQYDQRIRCRSGIDKGGDSGWSRADGYPKEFEKSKQEAVLLDKPSCFITMHQFDEEVSLWGSIALNRQGFDPKEFEIWSEKNKMLRSIGTDPLNKSRKLW
jgi:hypothetical protein